MKDRLIVALDVPGINEVQCLSETLGDSISFYKVGMELFYSVGNTVLSYLKKQDKKIFVDLKLHDIPNTVAKGTAELTELGVNLVTVHASGGREMMKAAAEAAAERATALGIERPKIVAVTVLTSIDAKQWNELGYTVSIDQQAVRLAELAKASGLDGVVASPQEASLIRKICGPDFLIVTPGIRPQGSAINDQSRVATPYQALVNGASHLVIGRPITKSDNPKQAAEQILREMETV